MQIKHATWWPIALLVFAGIFAVKKGGAEARDVETDKISAERWADSVLAHMTLRQKVAQMIWPNLIGDYVASDNAQWQKITASIQNEGVGGVLISVGSPIEIAAKLNALQSESSLPLLVSADFETGAGMRARGGYFVPNGIDLGGATVFPSNMAFGAAGDTSLAYEAGKVTAIEGRSLGVHINYAPVLDVNNNPANPVINTRSYGEDPHLVARMGSSFIKGLQENGMLATGKHFPGHGDTDVNSHLSLPTVNVSRARLDSVELVPFKAAIKAGVSGIMTFHGAMPSLDKSGVPGTLSYNVNTKLLREELGFNGLIISDAMDMGGVVNEYGAAKSSKMAVAAGVDILIQPPDVKVAIDAVVGGIKEGLYKESRIEASARKILVLKHQLGLVQNRYVNIDSLRYHVGIEKHTEVAAKAASASITVIRNNDGVLPVKNGKVLSVTFAQRTDLAAGAAFDAALKNAGLTVRSEFVSADDALYNYQHLNSLVGQYDVVFVSSYVGQRWNVTTAAAPKAFVDWVAALGGSQAKSVLFAFGNPYLLQQVPAVKGYLIAWSSSNASQVAAAKAATGNASVSGRTPVSIPPLAQKGDGLTF